MTDEPIRLAMWSGPRNLSTAMMRSWENRPDTVVMDEPLYAAYLSETQLDHPGRDDIIAAGIADRTAAIAACLAPVPDGITVSYQKHMAHHLDTSLDTSWTSDLRNCLLLRDPRRVLASYTKVREDVTLHDIGIPQQAALADRCELVIDSADFLTDPRAYQSEICRRFDVPLDDRLLASMLSWPPGRRPSDGVWARHWYRSVESSTGFGAAPTDSPDPLPNRLTGLAGEAMEVYETLRRRRLRPDELP